MVAIAVGVAGGSALVAPAAHAAPTRAGIVSIATRELNNSSRNHEIGNNCSYYGGVMFGWPSCGGRAGWGGGGDWYAWCAAFAKYVWREAGVTSGMSQIDGYARSFKTYGQNQGTWHSRGSSYVPKPGDAVTFDWGNNGDIDHVGIVTSLSGTTLRTIEGNTSDRVARHTYYNYKNNSQIEGFTTAVGVTQETPPVEPEPWVADVTGDGFHDLVGRTTDGTLMLYSNNFVRDDGDPYSTSASREIGSGWGNFNTVVHADVTGDGFADLVARKPDGTLWLYSNNFVRDDGDPYSTSASRQIGSGWNNFNTIIGADVTGDGFADLVARKPDGTLWLYSNNFVRDDGDPYSTSASRQIGSGWNNFNTIIGADVTGDGFADLVARKPDGTLWLYSNNFVRDDGDPYSTSASRQIGSGWNNFNTIIGADVTGDGFADLVARTTTGTLLLYSNNFVRDDGVPYSQYRQIGSGWNNFNILI
ncbi:CHAP domain-containing protein [Verrucosispora sioxanthis]|uniref:CHAP domain-containing protein n=1 Tax=Verrucosispora sioxanthis TaxID=2499994 RepID=UPI002815AB7E|nr:tachylectin-related carbohydrate-binding protein [Verrucosispora sioxanthis]